MKCEYIRLENVNGLKVGSDKDFIEIDFKDSHNKLVTIEGRNGAGKSVLISSISPFATTTSLDERSSLPYITPGKNGYKEIHYFHDENIYVIKHYFKSTKDSHSVKSHFFMNGVDLNENGNVTSFLSLVEQYFGLTQEMMRLVRLGSNVHSFISLSPAKRKESIGKLIEEIDLYMKIYKKVNEDIRVLKAFLSSNQQNLYNCHISDLVVERDKLSDINKFIRSCEKDRDKLIGEITKIRSLEADNNVDELRRKQSDAEAGLADFEKTERSIQELNLQNATIDGLIRDRANGTNEKIEIQSKINSYRISTDNSLKNIERLQTDVKKITSDNDIQSLINNIKELSDVIKTTDKMITGFIKPNCTSEDLSHIVTKLTSFNQIGQMMYSFGNRPIETYLSLRNEKKPIDVFLKKQTKKNLSRVSDNDIKRLFNQLFQDDAIITPNCNDFVSCPYYRFSGMIEEFKDTLESEVFDEETLNYIKIISGNIDNMLNDIDRIRSIEIPNGLKNIFREKSILDRLNNKQSLFDVTELQDYLSLLRNYEIHLYNVNTLRQYEQQLSMYKKSGIDSQLLTIKQLEEDVVFYKKNVEILGNEIKKIDEKLTMVEKHIVLVTKYNDSKKYKPIMESTLENVRKILTPLESSTREKVELQHKLNMVENTIESNRDESRQLETKIAEYEKLMIQRESMTQKHSDLDMILKAVSTRKGIPVVYMKRYLGKIQSMANDLLKIVYDEELKLAKFEVTPDVFEVPYIVNNTKIPDVKYGSQSEVALMTIALSFALAHQASGNYNILLLDEIDAGLDEKNRSSFLRMLYQQMSLLKAEQVFIISHNLSSMVNIPMDVIRLSNIGVNSKQQNVIWESV